jgi:hypothetical protein
VADCGNFITYRNLRRRKRRKEEKMRRESTR